MNIRALRLVTGEDIIGVINDDGTGIVSVENPVKIMIVPGSSATQPSIGFAPFPIYATEAKNTNLTISRSHIIFDVEPDQEFINQYNSIFGSGIVTPSKNIII